MGPPPALIVVPDDIIRTVQVQAEVHGFAHRISRQQAVHSRPQHAAGVNGVDIVDIAHHSGGSACQQGVCHREVDAVVHTQELAGFGVDEGVLQLAEAVGILEEARRDAVPAVDLDDPVGQQINAIVEVLVEIRFLRQQDDRFGAQLPEQAARVGVVGTMGAQDAQVVTAHPAQVGYGNGGIQIRLQAHRIPIGLHVGIIRVAGAVDRVVKRIIDRRRAHPLVLCQLLQLALVQLRQGCGVLLLRVGKQDAAQRAAAVGKADHAVFGIGVDRHRVRDSYINYGIKSFHMKKITIAIDGFSSCGKSTMAKDLAREIGYIYIDSGAMYRAVTLYSMENGIFTAEGIDTEKLKKQINSIRISFQLNPETGRPDTYLNDINVEKKIRTMEVSSRVSPIAALDFVREAMVAQQQEMGKAKGIVMDGRDIGTTVFPDAELKIFVTASPEIRAQRRYDELKAKGEEAGFDEILENVKQRDYIDQNREVSPLRKADDALLLDNSHMTISQQKEWLAEQFEKVCKS